MLNARPSTTFAMNHSHHYAILLAGGIGRRLWPSSRRNYPKQFIDFFGTGRTLLQQTYDRFCRVLPPENIYISTFKDYTELVHEQLPDVADDHILAEPVQLSTAPAAAWASCHIGHLDEDACIVATPSDHHILHEDAFVDDVRRGLDFVNTHNDFLAIGVKATIPNTAYGYIQMGENGVGEHLYRVKSFSEKPAADYARLFVDSEEFLWNTGLFLWNARTMLQMVSDATAMGGHNDRPLSEALELDAIRQSYPASVHCTIDQVILEKCKNVYVMLGDFGWADVGCWPELYAVADKDADGNAVLTTSHVMFSGSRNNLVRLPHSLNAVIKGLDGYLVAQEGNMLVICPNDDPALVRRLLNEAQMQLGEASV